MYFFGMLFMVCVFVLVIENNGGGMVLNIFFVLFWFSGGNVGVYIVVKVVVWVLMNDLCLNLYFCQIRVVGLYVGFMEIDMIVGFDVFKLNFLDVVRMVIDGIESGSFEIFVDDNS